MSEWTITLALCTHNHSDRLARTLADLRRLRAPGCDWELLIIDNGSTDATSHMLAGDGWRPVSLPVRVVREEVLGLSNARNRAVREARGEYIVFIDDDETPDRDWLRAYRETIEIHRPDAFGGRIEVMFEGQRPAWLQDDVLAFLGKLDHGEARWLYRAVDPDLRRQLRVSAYGVRAHRQLRRDARAQGCTEHRRRRHRALSTPARGRA